MKEKISNKKDNLVYGAVSGSTLYTPWFADDEFFETYQKVSANTLIGIERAWILWDSARQTSRLNGSFIEIGCWNGGSGAIIAKAIQNTRKKVYLCDTFRGVVKAGEHDTKYVGGEHNGASKTNVEFLLDSLGLKNAIVLEGIFPEETGKLVKSKKIAFCHIDVDTYLSAKDAFNWIYPRTSKGAIIVFDDYGFEACTGITKFINELKETKKELRYIYNISGQCIVVCY